MALTGKITTEFGIKTPASKFFNLFSKQLHHVQNITDRIHGGKIHQGDDWHGPDSVKHWTYTIDGKVVTCKEKIEHLDEENKSMTFNLFEGDIAQQYKIFKLNVQVIDKSGGGSTAKWTIEYEKINENVEPPYGYLDYLTKVTKDSDDHLLGA
ncbi:MLP-like protein 43 [Gastrolobium bilobum]|uniref:MLP-like protein 43 n=1 Tax=Gastrolobium bilobum TaxID=150636 RepID=UPI002AB009A3|nr:MLP-like protein 43 [Gastrolobium bilobum]